MSADVSGGATQAPCQYCREPLNDGARYCRGCGRKQPQPLSPRAKALLQLAAVIFAILGPAIYFVSAYYDRQDLLDHLHICALMANKAPVPTREAIAAEVDAEAHSEPWLKAVQAVGDRHGCTCSASSCAPSWMTNWRRLRSAFRLGLQRLPLEYWSID